MTLPTIDSLRARIGVAHLVLVLCIGSVVAMSVYFVIDRAIDWQVSQSLETNLQWLIQVSEDGSDTRLASADVKGYVFSPGDSAQVPVPFRHLSPGLHEVLLEGNELEVLVADVDGRRYIVSIDDSALEALESVVVTLLFAAVVTLGALLSVFGYWTAGIAIAPITRLAREIRAAEETARYYGLAGEWSDDEVGELAGAFNQYMNRLREFLVREQAFTADVSHELRNPIMAAATSVELLRSHKTLPPTALAQLARLSRAVTRMEELIDVFLEMARESNMPEEVPTIELTALAHDVVARHRTTAQQKGLRLQVDATATGHARGTLSAASVALENLVGNAVRHTHKGHVTVTVQEHAIKVSDSGPGIPANELEKVFERGYRGIESTPGGTGLGLSIVSRICRRWGWEVRLESGGSQGTTAHLLFAPGHSHALTAPAVAR